MLVIRSRAQGAGIFDVIVKAANSALAKKVITSAVNKAANSNLAKKVVKSGIAKKVINSTVGKTIAENVTKENFKKAANSALGKQLTSAVVTGVANASEKVANDTFRKLGIAQAKPGTAAKVSEKALENLGFLTPEKETEKKNLKRKRQKTKVTEIPKKRYKLMPGRRKRKLGSGIILE